MDSLLVMSIEIIREKEGFNFICSGIESLRSDREFLKEFDKIFYPFIIDVKKCFSDYEKRCNIGG